MIDFLSSNLFSAFFTCKMATIYTTNYYYYIINLLRTSVTLLTRQNRFASTIREGFNNQYPISILFLFAIKIQRCSEWPKVWMHIIKLIIESLKILSEIWSEKDFIVLFENLKLWFILTTISNKDCLFCVPP